MLIGLRRDCDVRFDVVFSDGGVVVVIDDSFIADPFDSIGRGFGLDVVDLSGDELVTNDMSVLELFGRRLRTEASPRNKEKLKV